MEFSVNNISSVVECNNLIANANETRTSLIAKQTVMNIQRDGYADDTTELQEDIASANAELQTTNDFIAIAPEGKAKLDAIEKQKSLELKLMKLNRRMSERGATALLEKESDLNSAEKQIQAVDEYITALQTRLTQLAA